MTPGAELSCTEVQLQRSLNVYPNRDLLTSPSGLTQTPAVSLASWFLPLEKSPS